MCTIWKWALQLKKNRIKAYASHELMVKFDTRAIDLLCRGGGGVCLRVVFG